MRRQGNPAPYGYIDYILSGTHVWRCRQCRALIAPLTEDATEHDIDHDRRGQ
jgi:hypothetical protein